MIDPLLGRENAVWKGLTTEADWQACDNPELLLHFLRDKGTDRRWRLFAEACCRRIDHLITDERSRRAIEVAAQYAEGIATIQDLEAARVAAQAAQEEAKREEWSAEADENFRLTPRYAAVSRALLAAQAARSSVCRDPRATDDEPSSFEAAQWGPTHDWAVAAARWNVYAFMSSDDETPDAGLDEFDIDTLRMSEHGKLGPGPLLASVEEAAEVARQTELRAHCEILRDLFGEFLGPPGDEGKWMPCGAAAPVSEWLCRLPTPKRAVVRPEWMAWSGGAIPKLARQIYSDEEFDRLPGLADALEKAGCNDSTILDLLRSKGPHLRGCWVLDLLIARLSGEGRI